MISVMAISGAVSMPVSMCGMSICSRRDDTASLISAPPSSVPRMMEPTVRPFDPAVGDHQLGVRQVFGEDAVFRRRVGGGAQADHAVGDERMHAEQHHRAADDLDGVGDEHHMALGQGIGEGADERRQHDVGNREEELEHRRQPRRRIQQREGRDGGDQQRVVGERRKKLRRHDDVKTERHEGDACPLVV